MKMHNYIGGVALCMYMPYVMGHFIPYFNTEPSGRDNHGQELIVRDEQQEHKSNLVMFACETKYGRTFLHVVSCSAQTSSYIDCLIAHPVLLDLQDDAGNTPLHYAAASLNKELVQKFIKAGATKTITNKFKETALDVALNCSAIGGLYDYELLTWLLADQQDLSYLDVLKQNFNAMIGAFSKKQLLCSSDSNELVPKSFD